jgi:LuxR family maltose regulon positive regulatory protein
MVSALLAHAVGDRTTAYQDIAAALALGVPAGYRRMFLDEAPEMQTLLAAYAADEGQSAAAGLARTLLAEGNPTLVSPAMPFGVEKLSDRELEVVRLLATDLTGPEIAGRLFVSINTLRTHTKHIFTKLDVKTRRAAVTRASDLNLR